MNYFKNKFLFFMENFLNEGFAYIKENLIENEKPDINSPPVGILEKGEIIYYKNLEKNDFGFWISYTKDDIKRYVLAKDNQNNFYTNLPKIKDGSYFIKPFEENDDELKIDFFNKKLLIQFLPEDDCYRIIKIESNNSFASNENKIIEECEIFSEKEIKWKIKTFNFNEFYFEDSKTGLQMEYSNDSKQIILSNINDNSNFQKFILIPIDQEEHNNNNNNKEDENKNDENLFENNINNNNNNTNDNNINNNNNNNNDDYNIDNDDENINYNKIIEKKNNKKEDEEEKKEINLEINPEVLVILDDKNDQESLKFLSPKIIITEEDVTEIKNKDSIKHIVIDNSIEEIEEKIFDDFKNIESIYCEPKWINKFNQKTLKEIYIKEGTTKIEKIHFKFCFKLNVIYLPNSQEIEENSFQNCLEITKIYAEHKWFKIFDVETFQVPLDVTTLKREVFFNWKHLKLILVPPCVNEIEEGCFEQCVRLEEIDIPNGVKIIPKNCFKNCLNLRSIKIPDSVINIDGTAFIGCVNLENIFANEKIKLFFQKILKIPENIKHIQKDDYKEYKNIETLEIPLKTEVDKNFFKNFPFLRVVNFDPVFLNFVHKPKINVVKIPEGITEIIPGTFKDMFSLEYIEIPNSMEKIEKNEFSDCINVISVKCQPKFLDLFDKENLTSLILNYGEIDFNSDPFKNCENLESIIIPDFYELFEEFLFRNCRKLNDIKYLSGKEKKFKTFFEVPSNITNINSEDFFFWNNVDTLIVNENVENITEGFLENCEDLQIVQIDPKFLRFIPKSEIVTVIVPKFVKFVDENDFEGCEKLKKVIFLGETELIGSPCKEFEKIEKLECDPFVLLHSKKNVRDNITSINILDGSVFLYDENLKDFTNLQYINFPNTLKFVGERCFSGCKKIERIYIPYHIESIPKNAFENCPNLTSVLANSKFLDCLPKKQICNLDILNRQKNIENVSFEDFKSLKKIEFSEEVENVPSNNFRNCPKLTQIICAENLLKNLENKDKENFQNIELNNIKEQEIPKDLFNNCTNLENINIPYTKKLNTLQKKTAPTSIEEIMKKDPDNLKYKNYLISILNDIKSENNTSNGAPNSLGEIANCITKVCIQIKNYTKNKSNGKRVMIPHPVQVITIIRICDEILNGRGAIAEVKTGEGKSFIISVIAIVLALHGRLIDVVTSNLELAIRDEKDQRDYYKLFNIRSGVLCQKEGDKDFLNLMKSQIVINNDNDNDTDYNVDVFEKEIVYSTNYNFEFAYLNSLFSDKPLRNRPYDVVIVDEVDNMFLDQSSSPAIIAYGVSILYHKDILEIIYLLKDNSVDDIIKVLKYYFPEGIDFSYPEISKLKKSAISAERYEKNVDYILENGEVIIVDRSTGYKKLGSRWQNCIHEFVEIKEEVKVKEPTISTCSITQCTFFNMYKSITGLSGTLGDDSDEKILSSAYKIRLFRVPRNLPSKVPVRKRERPFDPFELYELIAEEIIEITSEKRPVLVIFDTIKQVEEFLEVEGHNFDPGKLGTIQGIIPQNDRETIQIAGTFSYVTIATAAAGRGMDIKLDKISLENGGLHVIIPYQMENERVFWQCVGRCGRQGQPGSCTQYVSDDDCYYATKDFDPKFENLLKLQNKFANFLKTNWNWLYASEKCAYLKVDFTFNISIEKMLQVSIECIPPIQEENDKNYRAKLTSYYLDLILKAWGLFYSRVEENLSNYNSYEQMEHEYNVNFMEKLNEWIPANCKSVDDAKIAIFEEKIRRVDWFQVLMDGLQVVGAVVSICFPEIAPVIIVLNIALSGGERIYKKLKNHENINWLEEFLYIGIDVALNVSKLKIAKKGIGKIGKFIANNVNKGGKLMKLGQNLGRLKNFYDKIDNKLNKNLAGRIIQNIGKGIAKDINDRRDEYVSSLQEIGKDLATGKIPSEKIMKLIVDGTYNGVSNASLEYINKKMGEKKTLKKQFFEGAIKTIGNFSKEVTKDVLMNKDLLTSFKHNSYKSLAQPLQKWVNNKMKGENENINDIKKTVLDEAFKTVDSFVLDLMDGEKQLFKVNGQFNNILIDDFFRDLGKNEQKGIEKLLKDKIKNELIKKINEEKKKREE